MVVADTAAVAAMAVAVVVVMAAAETAAVEVVVVAVECAVVRAGSMVRPCGVPTLRRVKAVSREKCLRKAWSRGKKGSCPRAQALRPR